MAFLVDHETSVRFLHVLSGITWIGMLYFFNLVNLPLLKIQLKKPYEANMAEKASAHISIKTLFFFRWGAMLTLVFGLLLAGSKAETIGLRRYFLESGMNGYSILLGVLLGLVMFFNVWFVIWPRQQKILTNNKAIAASSDDAEKKRLGDLNAPMLKDAVLASRVNTWLSIPMLWGMVFGAHGPGGEFGNDWYFPVVLLGALLLLMAAYSQAPKPKAGSTPPASPPATPPSTPPMAPKP